MYGAKGDVMNRLLGMMGLVLLIGCNALVANPDGKAKHLRVDRGDVLIRSSGPRHIVVLVDTFAGGRDGVVDQWYILESAQPFTEPVWVRLPVAELLHRDGSLRVTAHEQRAVYDFVVHGAEVAAPVPQGFAAVRNEGFGLSHGLGVTTVQLARFKPGAVTTLDEECPECMPLNDDWGVGGTSAPSCDGGGVGSSSCSVTSGSNSCSTTCSSGYYACCQFTRTGVSCKCHLN